MKDFFFSKSIFIHTFIMRKYILQIVTVHGVVQDSDLWNAHHATFCWIGMKNEDKTPASIRLRGRGGSRGGKKKPNHASAATEFMNKQVTLVQECWAVVCKCSFLSLTFLYSQSKVSLLLLVPTATFIIMILMAPVIARWVCVCIPGEEYSAAWFAQIFLYFVRFQFSLECYCVCFDKSSFVW